MKIPTFRNEVEAGVFAERNKPYQNALSTPQDPSYERRYGVNAARAAEACRIAAIKGDNRRLHLNAISLSTILLHECPEVFEPTRRRLAA